MKPIFTNQSKARKTGLIFLAPALALLLSACERAPVLPVDKEPLSVFVTLSTNSISVGDQFFAAVVVDHPANADVQLPEPGRDKEVVVRDRQWTTDALTEERARTTVRYTLTSFRLGDHILTTGQVHCALSGGEDLEIPFPFTTFTVESTLSSDDEVMRDIKGLAAWPRAIPRWVRAFLIVIIIALVAALILKRFLDKPRTIIRQPPPPPAHETALLALQRLRDSGWIEEGNIGPFYVEVSSIVRRYIEDRFQLRAQEQTTEEFIRAATASRCLSPNHQQLTRDFLELSDLVKFARHEPANEDMQAALQAAEQIVRETIPYTEEDGEEEQS